MTCLTFTIKLQSKYEKLFMLYTRLFYMNWRRVDFPCQSFEEQNWEYGPSVMLYFHFAMTVYNRVYGLLQLFVSMTRAKVLLHDHSDNPYEADPKPYLLEPNMVRIKAAFIVIKEAFLYKIDHLKAVFHKRRTRHKVRVQSNQTNDSFCPF